MKTNVRLTVIDAKGEETAVTIIPVYNAPTSPLREIRAAITFVDGDSYMTWLPVFTEWFVPATYCYCGTTYVRQNSDKARPNAAC